ncbi:MAG TPA: rhodanese-related sulfurtransferase [Allosphingosinicella sp.]|nr:rhodanese-related sulfurtransferase [Allosphingosinicella sp.]
MAADMNLSLPPSPAPVTVAALYRFARLGDLASLRDSLEKICRAQGIRGTLLLAPEGVNGTVAGTGEGIACILDHIRQLPGCADLDVELSQAPTMPFHRMKVRIKREIVTMGKPGIDPQTGAGTYVEARDWNALISDANTIVIDTRNAYEVAVGTFAGAIDPETERFRDFPLWFAAARDRLLGSGSQPRVAMFCTGGIRCEKATALLKGEGVEAVFHLKGGILKYLETVPEEESLWQGECFVFDQRVTVSHGLARGTYQLCHACRGPLGPDDLASPLYEAGVSCAACHFGRTDEQRASYRERQRQELLAAARGEAHVGAAPVEHSR